jgi:hypothetical protein
MISLYTWARKWGIPVEAVHDLRVQMGIDPSQPAPIRGAPASTEAEVGKRTRLSVAENGGLLWRNNVGAMQDANGNFIRFGLANESKAINEKVKSSDYVGIIPITVLPEHMGMQIGQFVAIETKEPGWTFSGTKREIAQRKFLELVVAKGGRGSFYNGVDELVI